MVEQHQSLAYVEMICNLLAKGNVKQLKYWRKFRKLGFEYPVEKLAVSASLMLMKRYSLGPRQCYFNAVRLVMDNPFTYDYVEGVATSVIPTEHAWVVDKTYGWVIDPTWVALQTRARKPEHKIKDYFGVRIPIEIMRAALLESEIAGPLLPLCIDRLKVPKRTKVVVIP